MSKSSSAKTFLQEIEKCDVLCANCHREFHYLNKEYEISYDDYINNTFDTELLKEFHPAAP